MPMIEVTQEDIDNAIAGREAEDSNLPATYRCPVVEQALDRLFGYRKYIVGGTNVYAVNAYDINLLFYEELTQRIKEFIWDFDMKRPIKPAKFRISLP